MGSSGMGSPREGPPGAAPAADQGEPPGRPFSWTSPWHVLAFGFGAGLAPRAPGTIGTLVAVPIHLLIAPLPLALEGLVVAALAVAGIAICGRAAEDLGVGDHPGIVWDEIVGFLLTMLAAPAGWPWIVAGFVAFRFFDIVKPWPVSLADREVHGGLGVMLDDLIAGLYAGATLLAARAALGA